MRIDGNKTVAELINELEHDIAEQTALLQSLRRFVVIGKSEMNGHSAPKSVATKKKPSGKAKGRKKSKAPTLADCIAVLLKEANEPMTQAEIKKLLIERGFGVGVKNFTSGIYTAIDRRKDDVFRKLPNGRWELRNKERGDLPPIDATELAVAG